MVGSDGSTSPTDSAAAARSSAFAVLSGFVSFSTACSESGTISFWPSDSDAVASASPSPEMFSAESSSMTWVCGAASGAFFWIHFTSSSRT